MTKTMCKKTIGKRELILNKEARFVCKKCEATAHKKKHLCNPEKVKQ